MTTSRQTSFLSEIASENERIPERKLAFLQERVRNNLYNFVIGKFLERERDGFTKAQLCRRIGYDPARISKLLGAPGNWTIATVSDLLVGIAAEELVPASESLIDRPSRNYTARVRLEEFRTVPAVGHSADSIQDSIIRAEPSKLGCSEWVSPQ
jgi:hypothetical protein